jgi:hypothetical protein
MRRGSTRHRSVLLSVSVALAALIIAAVFALFIGAEAPASAQAQGRGYRAPRAADGHPDLSGIWQAVNAAHWNLEAHVAKAGPVVSLGALGAVPAGLSVIEGGEIPYQPSALQQRNENAQQWMDRDPAIKCYLPGVPRATYLPFPFQIVQGTEHILLAYEFAATSRTLYVNGKDESPLDTWMGWSNARWEGETLVVDVKGFNDQTWLDAAGNFHSEQLHVVERYTRTGPDHLMYEATIEDPKVFTRPWTIRMPLYRRVEANAQLLEFKCVEFAEELMYGHLTKKPTAQ